MEKISSRKNDNVRLLRSLFREKQTRDEKGLFAVEGDHLCGELSRADYRITLAAYTEKAAEKYPETVKLLAEKANAVLIITEELSEYISDTKSPQGLFAAAETKPFAISENARKIIVLDGVQDPGNVGTIIRTAEALGADGVVLLENCADILSPKTLRASMGSVFRFPVVNAAADALAEMLDGFEVYGAMLDKTANRLGKVTFPEKTVVVIGSEGAGISPKVAAMCGEKIYIPIQKAESLNAACAAALLMWELLK